ncbi:hypothetical protein ACKWRH_23585 [Bradyrhizobium sp. Pa8]|uniref:hypothetical protein n=1 Tax=Bradyrhizobium sp. Pa8 TaxID=3386552 RepID=UPI00403F4D6C
MAETHTAEELINKAAAILGKYVPGEALGDVEHQTIDKCIDDVLAEIAKIVAIADRDDIPNLVFETVARLVAIYAAAEFSNQPVDLAAVAQHEMRLRYLIAQTPTYEILATNHF